MRKRTKAAATQLLAKGLAYLDYATTEEIQAEREAAEKEKRVFTYSRRFMAQTPEVQARFEAEGRRGRPSEDASRRKTKHPRGPRPRPRRVRMGSETDHVIQRADGSCLYHLASVVDDHDLEITHVIRAEEHLSNTPIRPVFIAQGLGYELPQYAHLPFVAEPGSRQAEQAEARRVPEPRFAELIDHGLKIAQAIGLSASPATFNPVISGFYEQVGYLPEAIVNYLALLGWARRQVGAFYAQELIENFSLERVNKAPASFDPKKLQSFEEWHMQRVPVADKVRMVTPFLERAGLVPSPMPEGLAAKVAHVVQAAGDRIKVAGDILRFNEFFVPDERLALEDAAFDKHLGKPAARDLLARYRDRLAAAACFDAAALDAFTHRFVEEQGIKIGEIIHAIRVAVTGKAIGLGLFDAMAILGEQSVLARIERSLARAGGMAGR